MFSSMPPTSAATLELLKKLHFFTTLMEQLRWFGWIGKNNGDNADYLLQNYTIQNGLLDKGAVGEDALIVSNPIEFCSTFQQYQCDLFEYSNLTNFSVFDKPTDECLTTSLISVTSKLPMKHRFLQLWWIRLLTSFVNNSLVIPNRFLCIIFDYFVSYVTFLLTGVFLKAQLDAIFQLTFIILLIIYIYQRLSYWRWLNVPYYIFRCSFFGWNSTDISLVRCYGKIFGTYKLFTPNLNVADYNLIENILVDRADYFAKQNTCLLEGHLLSNSIFTDWTQDIARWKRKKAILLSSFLSRKLKLLKPTVDNLTGEFERYLREKTLKCSINSRLNDLIFPFVTYSLLTLIFDIELPRYRVFIDSKNHLSQPLLKSTRRFLMARRSIQQSAIGHLFPRFLLHHSNLDLLNKESLERMQVVIGDAIRYREENGLLGLQLAANLPKRLSKKSVKFRDEIYATLSDEYKLDNEETAKGNGNVSISTRQQAKLKELTFIDIMFDYDIEPEDKLEGYDLSRQELLDNLTAFFTISLATLERALAAVLFYLTLYQNEQNRVRQEVIDYIGRKADINWESLRNLKYTEAVVKEVLRLQPPIEKLERVATKAVTIESTNDHQEIHFPAGQLITLLISAVHYDAEIYPNPYQFNPNRFYQNVDNSGDNKFTNAEQLLTFGLGARSCLGLKFVHFYIKHFIAHLLFDFELRLPPTIGAKKTKDLQSRPISMDEILNTHISIVGHQSS